VSESIELSPVPASVALARRWSLDVAARCGFDHLADTMVLLVSELVSNAVLHARTPCSLHIAADAERIRVEVADGSDHLPAPPPPADPLAPSGRGLLLMHGLSSACGVDAEPHGGKRVWFELATDRSRPLA
jgi:anti-sigma regulatory factor (Ser/Thr protein kinase)